MTIIINSNKRALKLSFRIINQNDVYALAFDYDHPQREFVSRIISTRQLSDYEILLPQTAKKTALFLYSKSGVEDFSVSRFSVKPLKTEPFIVDELTRDFVNFAEKLAFNYSFLKPGLYTDKKRRFKVNVRPRINHTALRINVFTDVIEISLEHIRKMTVSGVFLLLLHEYAHNFLSADADSEKEADNHAVNLYIKKGYPFIETFYVFESFSGTDENMERLEHLDNLLTQLNKAKQ